MDYENMIKNQMADLDLEELERIMDDAAEQSSGIFSSLSTDDIIDSLIAGEPVFDTGSILESIRNVFILEV